MPSLRPAPDRPIVTLTTDFGLSDHYVGTMKGVIFSRCPQAHVVDITHRIEAHNILPGAYAIAQAAPYFPPGTIHVVVVDPGVGTSRRAILLETDRELFIAPDNGVLTLVAQQSKQHRLREIANRSLFLPDVSSTFHGRDVFAATAGALASGMASPADVGPELESMMTLSALEPVPMETSWQGVVLSVDHFGNVITNFRAAEFAAVEKQPFTLHAGTQTVQNFFSTFGLATDGVPFLYFGSSGYLEIAINRQSAAEMLHLRPGSSVQLSLDR